MWTFLWILWLLMISLENFLRTKRRNLHTSINIKKSISTVKVLKAYALEIGIPEKEWDEGVNKAVDKHYGSKYDKDKTEKCHSFVEALVPNGAERVKKVVQTLY